MPLLSFNRVSFSYGTQSILRNASFIVRENSKTGLIGRNGSGKSTIVKLILEQIKPDTGEITKNRNLKLGFVLQEIDPVFDTMTLLEFIRSEFRDIFALEDRINELEREMSEIRAHSEKSPAFAASLEEYSRAVEKFEHADGYSLGARIRSMLAGLGFKPEELEKPLGKFSGGMRTRAQLCRILLKDYELIVLDEPTNYLDTGSLEFLENFLKSSPVAALIISHDRYFLDAVCDHILYLYNEQIEESPGNYTDFTEIFELRQNQRIEEYERQQEFIKKTEDFYLKYHAGIKSKMARGRKKFIDRMERIGDPSIEKKSMNLDFSSRMGAESGRVVVSARDIEKSFGEHLLFSRGSFEVGRGSIVGIIGANGTGKTTLLKAILGSEKLCGGELTIGHNVVFGYQDQLLSGLDPSKRVIDEIWDMKKTMLEGEVRKYLAKFLFSGDDVFKRVSALSGGEKSRLILSKIIMTGANTLILDEPTNHLDIESKEMLEEALLSFDGSVIFVSHDRYFIDKVANGLVSIENGFLTYCNGNYSYFKEKCGHASEKPRPEEVADRRTPSNAKGSAGATAAAEKSSKKQLSKNAEAQIQKQIGNVEAEISSAEAEIARIEGIFASNSLDGRPLSFEDTERLNGEYTRRKEETERLYQKWQQLHSSLE